MSGMEWLAVAVGAVWLLIVVVVVLALLQSRSDRELGFHRSEVERCL